MGLFGRTSCNEDRSWSVECYTIDGDRITLTEQLNKKEATAFYKEIEKELTNNKPYIKVFKDGGEYEGKDWLIVKSSIIGISLVN